MGTPQGGIELRQGSAPAGWRPFDAVSAGRSEFARALDKTAIARLIAPSADCRDRPTIIGVLSHRFAKI